MQRRKAALPMASMCWEIITFVATTLLNNGERISWAILTCIFVGYVVGPKMVSEEVESSGGFKRKKMFEYLIRYIAPIFIILILLSSVANGLGLITI